MNTWSQIRCLLLPFLLASGVLTWHAVSGGIIFWDALPLYGTPATFLILVFEIMAVSCAVVAGLLARRLRHPAITLGLELIFTAGYYFLLADPTRALPYETTIANPFLDPTVISFGIGLCCGLSSAVITFINHPSDAEKLDGLQPGDPSYAPRIASLMTTGVLLGFSIVYLDYGGTLWVTSLLAMAIPGVFGMIAMLDFIERKGRDKGGDPPVLTGKIPAPDILNPGTVAWRFFLMLGFGTAIVLAFHAASFTFIASFPSIMAGGMARITLVVMFVSAGAISLDAWLLNKHPFRVTRNVQLGIELGVFCALGFVPALITMFSFESIANWGVSVFLMVFLPNAIYFTWRLGTAVVRDMQKARKIASSHPVKFAWVYAVPASISAVLFFGLLAIGVQMTGSEGYVSIILLVFPFIGVIAAGMIDVIPAARTGKVTVE